MIEFKGAYINKLTDESKSVLVQFDGVLLHVWHIADPFYRLFVSDVFTLKLSLARGKRCIKLPNGGTIETDDTHALVMLDANYRALDGTDYNRLLSHRNIIYLACGFILLAGTCYLFNLIFSP